MNRMDQYMLRALELAGQGSGWVAPNPMVGAVLVHNDRIIGEGFHEQFGEGHAEVNCLRSVQPKNQHLIAESTLFVTLDPCSHFGKTPPCCDLILEQGIKQVVVGSVDPNPAVQGRGIARLKASGVEVISAVLEEDCRKLNKRFYCFHQQRRPYIVLKWAQSSDGKIAGSGTDRLLISNGLSNRLVHRWRAEEAAVMVGRKTVSMDNPVLNNRLWYGANPIRIVADPQLSLSGPLNIFDQQIPTIIINSIRDEKRDNLHFVRAETSDLKEMLDRLYQLNILSVLVEGGQNLLQQFIDSGYFDEIRIIENQQLTVEGGLNAPVVHAAAYRAQEFLDNDRITYYTKS